MSIQVVKVSKTYGTFAALQEIDLEIPSGQLCALLGPSGSGKTTLLRLLAGLEKVEQGQIYFDAEDVTGRSVRERKVGFVFQHYALFRHMTVFQNVAFGLQVLPRKQRPSKAEIHEKVDQLLQLVQLKGLENRYPAQLSGGQRQRVALARALAIEPKVLMLDEPFGALDAKVRQDLRQWLRQLHDQLHITSLFVTHDQEEALEIADRVVILNNGRIEQVGTPEEVYHHPVNPFVLHFLGRVNRVQPNPHDPSIVGYTRPHEFDVSRHASSPVSIKAVIRRVRHFGAVIRLDVARCDTGDAMQVEIGCDRYAELALKTGETIFLTPRVARFFAGADGGSITHSSQSPIATVI
ncbi:sulfate/molybdate ABC transporter ATP-binding protein [Effusibacillus pohliae]|uniref:sulfate/molybdate ABC transporter ATP-binding protein n=1 Tax=Effusibacillus pohliae TaxID=232270 RepID=UPI0003626CD2|nr:sulfate ABC transporter ATP-binding protein [Effusibacillus pohliae]